LSLALLQVDWDSLDHAYGPAGDAPAQLLALAGDDPEARSRAVGYAPQAADDWFAGWLPGQEGWLHRDLATALAARATDLETVLPAAPTPSTRRNS
jgi:hypothetical protein